MTKWEYKLESLWCRTDSENIVELLRLFGLEGWELIATYETNGHIRHIFKRQLPPEANHENLG